MAGIVDSGLFGAKGAVEMLYRALHVEPRFEAGAGRATRTTDGIVRELADGWGYFELDLDSLFQRVPELPLYEDVINYPPVKQDLAFAVPEEVLAGDLIDAALAAVPELRNMEPFDVYRGEQVGPGRKSVAFSVEFRSPERTLTDEEAARLREKVVAALGAKFGAELRA